MIGLRFAVVLTTFLALSPAWSRTFQNSYIEFELPDQWTCSLEQTEWVCTEENDDPKKNAIIVLTAKVPGPDDRLDVYEDHLDETRRVKDAHGNDLGRSSQVRFKRSEQISRRTWIHAQHFESELPNYVTDYLATVDDRVAILLTFSAYKDVSDAAFQRFAPSIASIRPRGP